MTEHNVNQKRIVEPKWLKILEILIKYKFANTGTTETTADEIYNLFLNSPQKGATEIESLPSKSSLDGETIRPEDIHEQIKEEMEKDYEDN